MPLVRTYVRSGGDIFERDLWIACQELVPATYHVEEHPLTPGSIQFVPTVFGCTGLMDDVFVEAEGFDYPERRGVVDGDDASRPKELRQAFERLFPHLKFAVWPKLVAAGYDADSVDPEFGGDMSIDEALERARARIAGV